MREIPLTQCKVALVDDEDYERVSQYRWYAQKHRSTYYAHRRVRRDDGSYGTQGIHNLIIGSKGVDHSNGDGLDNRRVNLRSATAAQNHANIARQSNNLSGYKGVSWAKSRDCWLSQIMVSGHVHHLGYFDDPESAAIAYDCAADQYFGEFARPNFEWSDVIGMPVV